MPARHERHWLGRRPEKYSLPNTCGMTVSYPWLADAYRLSGTAYCGCLAERLGRAWAVQPCVVLGAAREDGGSAAARESCSALGGCHDRRLLQHGHAAGALARPEAGGAILARCPARTQRPGRHALRALRSSSRFAPSFVLCPGPLVATLPVQWRYLARLGDPSDSLAAARSAS